MQLLQRSSAGRSALRNRKKVGALVANAQEFERIRAEHGTFARYLRAVKSTGTLQACGPLHRGVLPSLRGAVRICSLNVAAKQEDAADRRVPAFEPGMRASRPPAADPQR